MQLLLQYSILQPKENKNKNIATRDLERSTVIWICYNFISFIKLLYMNIILRFLLIFSLLLLYSLFISSHLYLDLHLDAEF